MLRSTVVLLLSGLVAAAGPALLASPAVQAHAAITERGVVNLEDHLQGTIVAVDSDTITVKTMTGDGEKKVKIPPEATVQVNGQMATIEDLRVGHLVNVMASGSGSELVAVFVDARSQM